MEKQSAKKTAEQGLEEEEHYRPPPMQWDTLASLTAWSTLKGTLVGGVLGAGGRALTGPSTVVLGQPQVARQLLLKEASSAGMRIGGVFALYTSTRCLAEWGIGLPSAGPLVGGAIAVATPYAFSSNRQNFLESQFKHAFRTKATLLGRTGAVGSAAVSGAVIFGTVEYILRAVGLNW
eukprot:gb/GECG01010482.1/.p1 GENE.gb/GECG01010482.1/~~gb/GECG01010482.1/.p1  ORF type:complete len:178 (+),score=13.20 gb/GECG01010482.1/:1-534(+)